VPGPAAVDHQVPGPAAVDHQVPGPAAVDCIWLKLGSILQRQSERGMMLSEPGNKLFNYWYVTLEILPVESFEILSFVMDGKN
jgi:hypothetical protein